MEVLESRTVLYGPEIEELTPPDNSIYVPITSNLVIRFNQPVQRGEGFLVLKRYSDHSIAQEIPVSDIDISYDGYVATVMAPALSADTDYYVLASPSPVHGVFTSRSGENFLGLTSPGDWNFNTAHTPTVVGISPPDNSTGVPISSSLVMDFSEPMKKGFGTIIIRNTASGATQNILVNDSAISVEGSRVTIDPQDFAPSANYSVFIPGTAFTDLAGNSFGGINDHPVWLGEWDFATAPLAAPTVTSINRLVPLTQHTIAQLVTFRVTFSSPVTGVTADDFTLVDVANSIEGETITSVIGADANIVDVQVNTGTGGTGDLRLDVLSSQATIFDPFGNALATDFVNGETYTIHRRGEFLVNSLEDHIDGVLGDGIALDSTGHTTLRAAIMEANLLDGIAKIRVPAGIYSLAVQGQDNDSPASGDLDIAKTLIVIGDDSQSTIIDGGYLDRVFHVLPGADAKILNLTIRNGNASQGGGIRNQGTLTLDNVNLTGNHANRGGALYTEGATSIASSSLIQNFAYIGGGIYDRSSILTAFNSTIGENEATAMGGGLYTENGGNATLTNTTVYANKAQNAGGGLSADYANIILKNSIVAGNLAGNNPDLDGSSSDYYLSLGNNLIGHPGDVPGFVHGTKNDQVGSISNPLNPHLSSARTNSGSTIVYTPLYNSTAIDHGHNAGATATDQLGKTRVVDGDDDGTSTIDIGAVEYEPLTFIVNSFTDLPDTSPGDGLALDALGKTTLRAAIMEANTIPARVRIRVPAGIYTLSDTEQDDDTGPRGDLDIAKRVNIIGDGANATILDGSGRYRVFHVLSGADAKLSGLTIRNGYAALGGGILNQGALALDSVNLTNNLGESGGAIYSQGPTYIANSSLFRNFGITGGAVYSHSSSLTLLNSTMGENEANWGGGLAARQGTNATLINTTIYANRAFEVGGGISAVDSSIKLKNSIVAGKLAGSSRDLYSSNSNYLSMGNNLIGYLNEVPGFVDRTNGDQVGSISNPLDPHLGSAGTYGGSTIVYPLLANSTAIDHGNNVGASATDQQGQARIADGNDDGTDTIDIGAVELQPLTFVVNSFSDSPDTLPGDGLAVDATGHTTLRAAIMEANTAQARVRIRVPAGLYTLSIAGQFENAALFGDLDITKRVQIIGDGASATLIDGSGLDRVFHVQPGADARISSLTIRNGNEWQGGGILNQGTLALDSSILTSNHAHLGGALYAEGKTSIASSSLIQNFAYMGGAAYSHSASLTFINSTIGENEASETGGGLIIDNGGNVTLTNATVYANKAPTAGGLAAVSASIKLGNSIVAGNLASNNPDLYNSSSTYVSMGNNLIGNPSNVLGFINGINGDQVGVASSPLSPQLGQAGSYGGSTIVYPLLANSSAIDRGYNMDATTTDQLGNLRVADGDDDRTETIDIGAVEFEPLTFVVNSFSDLPDAVPGDGLAADVTGKTTLRAAIMEANTIQTPTRIRVPAGIYTLSIAGQYDDTAAIGDLDIVKKVKIIGDGASSTLIDGNGLDRIFQVLPGADAKLSNLTIRNGVATYGDGGGVLNLGSLVLDNTNLTGNRSYYGGAIGTYGPTTIVSSSLVGNTGYQGGAIYSWSVNLTLLNSTIGENQANNTGGGLVIAHGGNATLTNVTVHANKAWYAGGLAAVNGSITLGNTIVAGNLADNNPDLYNEYSTYVSLGNNLIGNPSDVLGFVNGINGDQVGVTSSPLAPHLGPAGTYGGSTIFYPPLYKSTAIDNGNNAEATALDQLGNTRVVDGDDNGSVRVDIGSVEFQPMIFIVNSFSDQPDISPGDGVAVDETGHTTLRAAIMEANSIQAGVRIQVPAGIYTLSLTGQDDDAALSGDLDIAKRVRIIGDSASATIIDAHGLDRVFHVLPGATATLANLTMRNGNASHGGGIRNQGTLTLDRVNLTGNDANYGGALYTEGTTSIANSSLIQNFAYMGGAIYNRSSILTASNSTIGENEASEGGGGLFADYGGRITLLNVTVSANWARIGGGLAADNASIMLRNTIVAGNRPGFNPDIHAASANYLSLGNNLIGVSGDVLGFINGTNGDQVGSYTNPLDPRLGSAGTYGGSTIVYPLLINSPAIDHGNSAGAAATDQLGRARITDGDDDGTNTIDIGAVEFEPPTFVVNSYSDFPDALPGDGLALDITGRTTLRAAIMEAYTIQATVRIRVPAGMYSLSIGGEDDDIGLRGDLDIAKRVNIIGDDADKTIVQSDGSYRVFHVLPGADAKFSGLTIRNGYAWIGGGVLNQGTLALDNVNLTSNRAHSGGAIYSEGPISIVNSSLVKNFGYTGGAIYSQSASLTLLNSTIGENEASWMGGGLVIENGTITMLIHSTVYANVASVAGGIAALDTRINVGNTIVAGNSGGSNPDIYGSNYVSMGNNLIGYSFNVIGFIDGTNGDQVGRNYGPLDPHLGPLGTYGGSTSFYPLLPNSTAIDRGNNDFASETDQLGNNRVTDGDDDGTDTVDIGAVEFEPLAFVVNSFRDLPDILPGDGKAVDATGHTTLRAAIMEANTIQARVRIRIPAGIYALSSAGQDDDTAAIGDLDIAKKVKIVGDNASSTIIDGSGYYRVFHVLPGADARLSNLTIRNGNDLFGGGVFSQGSLMLDKTNLTNNHANLGGAIATGGPTTITNSSLVKNFGYKGGAIYSYYTSLTLVNSTIGENEASETGGGLFAEYYGNVTLTNATVFANKAPQGGGLVGLDAGITLRNTIVAGNRGGYYPDLYGNRYTSMGNNLIGHPSDVVAFVDGTKGDQVGGYMGLLSPHLGPAGTYGGSTIVYPPLNTSTAIDRGDSVNATTTDQLGNARVIDGDDNGTEIVDIGAVEFASPTFIVNSFSDLPDTLPGDGLAVDETGHTTIRAAIMEANTIQTRVVIQVPAGIYVLTTAGQGDDSGELGDLDIGKKLRIIGDNAGMTLIDGSGLDRVFHVLPDADAQLSNLTIRNGNAWLGGGIRNQGSLTLHNSNLTSNHAEWGGAIYSEGPTSITNSSFVKNSANVAGALYNRSSTLAALNSTIGENHANSGGGLVSEYGGSVTFTNVTVYANEASIAGGLAALSASITLKNSIVAGNLSGSNPDLYGSNSSYLSQGHNLIGDPSNVPGFSNGTNGDQVGSIASPLDPRLGSAVAAGSLTIVYAPIYDSTAVDHGNNVGATATDQVGKARVTDGDDDGIDTIDIGAIEFQLPNHRPRINSVATTSLLENLTDVMTIVVTDADLPVQVIAFSITGGADKSKFNITPNGVLQFIASPDFENPTDTNFDNLYLVQVTANDGHGGIATQDLSVTVAPVNDNNPVFTSTNTPHVPENTTAVLTVTSTDADLPAQVITYSLTGGADQFKFSITPEGILSFVAAPVYSNPTDVNADNLYLVQVTANDGMGGSTAQNLVVSVVDVTAPTISALSPIDNATGVSRSTNLVLTFSEPIQKGTGNIAIRRGSDNSTFLSLPVSDNSVQTTGSTVTINPTDFASGTSYYVEIPAGAFKDLAGNPFAGIIGPTSWNFSTVGTATFSVSGTTLLLDLNSPNTNLSIVSVGTSYRLALIGSTWIGTDNNHVSGNGTAVLTLSSAGLLAVETISIADSATENSVTFSDSGTSTFADNFSIVLDHAGAGEIQFLGTTAFTGSASLNARTANGIKLFSGSNVRTINGNLTLRAKTLDGISTTVTSVSGSITSYVDSVNLSGTTTFQTLGVVQIAPSSVGMSIDLGGEDRAGYLGLTDAELDRISAGFLTIGNGISGEIKVSSAITTNTKLSLVGGSGGIISGGGYLGTSGDSISLDTIGPVGTSANRLLFADQGDTGKQRISVGTSIRPSSVYLGGLGTLSLARILGGNVNTKIDVTSVNNLIVAAGATINSGTNSLSLAADVAPNGAGNNGIGTLTIGANANIQGSAIALVGADEVIDSSANIGNPLAGDPLISTLTGLSGPYAIALDGSGNVFVANTTGNTVSKFAPGATSPSAILTGLDRPFALAFDANGNLFVANSNGTTVSKFLPGATTPSVVLTGLENPTALAFDASGNLFVANFGNGNGTTVSKFAPGATTPSSVLTNFNAPYALAFDPSGNLYVANYYGGKVSKFAPGSTTATALTGVDFPVALAFDNVGNLFVANYYNNTVSKFAPGALTPTATLQGLDHPNAFAIDSNNNLFVANYYGNSVSRFAPGATTVSATINQLNVPVAMAFDHSDNLLVANYGTTGIGSTVNKYMTSIASTVTIRPSVNGRSINVGNNTANSLGLTDAELDRVTTMKLLVGDANSGVITVSAPVTLNTNLTLSSSSGGIVSGGGSLGTSGDTITLNTSGAIGTSANRLLFADQVNTTKQSIFVGAGSQPSSIYLAGLGSLSLGNISGGSVSTPIDITAAANLFVVPGATINGSTGSVSLSADVTSSGVGDDNIGNLTISAYANVLGGSITLVGADEEISSTASIGTNPLIATLTGASRPRALAVDGSGNLFVANELNGTVSRFAPGATSPSYTLTQLNTPLAMAFDSSGNLFVANYGNNTVSKFTPGATTPSLVLTGLNGPDALAFDSSGNLFVANGNGTTVSKYAPGATTPTTTLIGLNAPTDLVFDGAGNLFVANFNGGTVSKFAPGATIANMALTGLVRPRALAFDSNGNLFVTDDSIGTVKKYIPGAAVPSSELTGLSYPYDLVFDSSGNLYVANFNGGTLSKFSPGSTTPNATINGLNAPTALTIDSGGNIFAANRHINTISKFAPSPASTVSIRASLNTQTITLGNTPLNTLSLTDPELDRINAATLIVGDANSGKVSFSGSLSPAGINTLVISSASDITQSFVGNALSGGAALVLKGNLTPALAAVGNFQVDANTSFDASSTFKVNLNGTSAYDQLIVSGNTHTINLGGAALAVTLDTIPSTGNVFKIIDSTGNNSTVNGTFKFNGVTLNNGDTFTIGNTHLRINYNPVGGPGDVVLTAVSQAILLSASLVNENAAIGRLVGNFFLAEASPGSTNFTLVAGEGSTDNASFTIDANGNLKTAAAFNYETKSNYSIRVRATNSSGQIEQTFNISVVDLPEMASAPVLGDGTTQHSLINKFTLTLEGQVTVDPGAFALVKRGTNEAVTNLVTQTLMASGQSKLVLTFSGALTRGAGALSDGYYQLTIDGSKIRRGSVQADLNGDGTGGDTLVIGAAESDNFFALYGDTNGDGVVGVAEFGAFRAAFGKSAQDAGYNALFDYEQDQTIGVSDFGQFRSRFGKAKLRF